MTTNIRPTAVAGSFYPADPVRLKEQVESYLAAVDGEPGHRPKAVIAPHAGYPYSGPVAASAFSGFERSRGETTRVVVVGPSHHVPFTGIARSGADGFATPLGTLRVDRRAEARLDPLRQVGTYAEAHAPEHALEVELPFVQLLLGEVEIVPLVFGDVSPQQAAEVLGELWGGDETMIVVSSDLSHFHDYDTARRLDHDTAERICGLERVTPEQACGFAAVNGLTELLRQTGAEPPRVVDLRSSGDTAGGRQRVVGYGAFVVP